MRAALLTAVATALNIPSCAHVGSAYAAVSMRWSDDVGSFKRCAVFCRQAGQKYASWNGASGCFCYEHEASLSDSDGWVSGSVDCGAALGQRDVMGRLDDDYAAGDFDEFDFDAELDNADNEAAVEADVDDFDDGPDDEPQFDDDQSEDSIDEFIDEFQPM